MFTNDLQNVYNERGWVVLKNFIPEDFFCKFNHEFNTLLSLAAPTNLTRGIASRSEVDVGLLLKLSQFRRDRLSAIYRSCRHLESLQLLLMDNKMLTLARSVMKTDFLNICPYTATRIDLFGETEYLFDWHQDYHYIQGSMNGLVLWIPLTSMQVEGSVEILDGSHKAGLQKVKLLDPFNKNKNGAKTFELVLGDNFIQSYDLSKPTLEIGDVLLFSTLLVHRSIPQKSQPVRVTTQLRYGDFMDEDSVVRGWPVGLLEGRGFELDHPEYVAT